MTVVVKLGSSIVADENGEVRDAVLDSVCAQVAELHHAGEDVAMVTSGAIALGWRLMELEQRPRTVDELQAASAVGQGSVFRAYESRLATRDVHAAQVLLTSYDLSVRMHYLNARQALRKLLEWRAVPVVNENDTTATDEITFGDNDFLSAQLALLLGARLLVLLTDTDGLYTADPARDPEAHRVPTVDEFAELDRYEIGDRTSLYRLRRHAQQGRRRRDGERRRDPGGDLRRDRCRLAARRRPWRRRRHQVRAAPGTNPFVQALAAPREARSRQGRRRRRRGSDAARGRVQPAAGRDRRRRGRVRGGRRGRGRL